MMRRWIGLLLVLLCVRSAFAGPIGGGGSGGAGGGAGTLDASAADQADTNSTTETTLYTYTLPGGILGTNQCSEQNIIGTITANGAGTLTIKGKYGSGVGTATFTPPAVTSEPLLIEMMVCGDGTTSAQQMLYSVTIGAASVVKAAQATLSVDSTAQQALAVTATWGTAAAGLSLTKTYAQTVATGGATWMNNPGGVGIVKSTGGNATAIATPGADYVLPSGSITGNAGTATALATLPTKCGVGNSPLGVDTGGNALNCFDVATQAELDAVAAAKQPLASTLTTVAGKTPQGTGTDLRLSTGVFTAGNYVTTDANGNFADGGNVATQAELDAVAAAKADASATTTALAGKQPLASTLTTLAAKTVQGTGAAIPLVTGSPAANDCAKFDASGNITTAGAACGSGGGGSVGTFQQVATNGSTYTGADSEAHAVTIGNGTDALKFWCDVTNRCVIKYPTDQSLIQQLGANTSAGMEDHAGVDIWLTVEASKTLAMQSGSTLDAGSATNLKLPVTGYVKCSAGSANCTGAATVPLADIAAGGATNGQVLTYNGSVWAPAASAGGGSGTTGTTLALTPGTDSAETLRINAADGTRRAMLGASGGGNPKLYLTSAAPTSSNYSLQGTGSDTILNAPTGSAYVSLGDAKIVQWWRSGNTSVMEMGGYTTTSGFKSRYTTAVANGTNIPGATVQITGGPQTGNAAGGPVEIHSYAPGTSGTTLSTADTLLATFPYDGGLKLATGTKPTCDSSHDLTLYGVAGSTGVADTAEFCTKSSSDTYAWTSVLGGGGLTSGGPLGTPSSGTLTNTTGLPISTGVSGLGTGVATALATPSSANIASAVTDETGSGALVFGTSPTLITPTLGAASATSLALSGTAGAGYVSYPSQSSTPSAPASGFVEFADATGRKSWRRASDGFVRTWDASLTADRVYTLQDASGTVPLLGTAQTWTAQQTFTSPKVVTDIKDTNGNTLLGITATGSAVNSVTLANAATGSAPTFTATGSDAAIELTFKPKAAGGTSRVNFFPTGSVGTMQANVGTDSTHYVSQSFNGSTNEAEFQTYSRSYPIVIDGSYVRFMAAGTEWLRVENGGVQLGVDTVSASPQRLNACDGSGTDKAGCDLSIAGGNGTGTGAGGVINLKTTPTGSTGTTQNTSTTRVTIPTDGGIKLATASKPTCDSGHRGTIFYVAGGASVADTAEICRKDAADAYAWVTLF